MSSREQHNGTFFTRVNEHGVRRDIDFTVQLHSEFVPRRDKRCARQRTTERVTTGRFDSPLERQKALGDVHGNDIGRQS
jgi:hypothetical protein